MGLLFVGMCSILVVVVVILFFSNLIWVVLLGWLFLYELLGLVCVVGLLLGMFGVVLVIGFGVLLMG